MEIIDRSIYYKKLRSYNDNFYNIWWKVSFSYASGEQIILQHLVDQYMTDDLLIMDKGETLKTLGLFWNSKQDSLQNHINLLSHSTISKRKVLSRISQISDPLGFVGLFLITGKIFMQQLWSGEVKLNQSLS